jgi:hypothetical protein
MLRFLARVAASKRLARLVLFAIDSEGPPGRLMSRSGERAKEAADVLYDLYVRSADAGRMQNAVLSSHPGNRTASESDFRISHPLAHMKTEDQKEDEPQFIVIAHPEIFVW